MRRLGLIVVLGLTAAGCARTPGPAAPAPVAETISYQAGPCFGRCPMFTLRVSSNGEGVFTGTRFTAVVGERTFRVSPAEYAAFARALAPYRPAPGTTRRYSHGEPGCENAPTDMPSAEIRWNEARGASGLYYYFGCDREANQAMADAIGNAPDLLPALEPLIGPRP